MKKHCYLAACLVLLVAPALNAYEIAGAKPISKLEEQQKKAIAEKKLITIVYRGSDTQCPHCATAAGNGMQAVRSSSVVLLINQKEAQDKSVTDKLPKSVQDVLAAKMVTGAWVAFHVFDPQLTKEIASADRSTLETDKKKISDFAKTVREAHKGVK